MIPKQEKNKCRKYTDQTNQNNRHNLRSRIISLLPSVLKSVIKKLICNMDTRKAY